MKYVTTTIAVSLLGIAAILWPPKPRETRAPEAGVTLPDRETPHSSKEAEAPKREPESPVAEIARRVTELSHDQPALAAKTAAGLLPQLAEYIDSQQVRERWGELTRVERNSLSDVFVTWAHISPAEASSWAGGDGEILAGLLVGNIASRSAISPPGESPDETDFDLTDWIKNISESDLRQVMTWKYAESLYSSHGVDETYRQLRRFRFLNDRNAAQIVSVIAARPRVPIAPGEHQSLELRE